MDNIIFEDQLKNKLQKMTEEQIVLFAWLCAVRALPFIGAKGNFNHWKQKDRQRHLYSLKSASKKFGIFSGNFKTDFFCFNHNWMKIFSK